MHSPSGFSSGVSDLEEDQEWMPEEEIRLPSRRDGTIAARTRAQFSIMDWDDEQADEAIDLVERRLGDSPGGNSAASIASPSMHVQSSTPRQQMFDQRSSHLTIHESPTLHYSQLLGDQDLDSDSDDEDFVLGPGDVDHQEGVVGEESEGALTAASAQSSDQEEFRSDRGVKVSRTEVRRLMQEQSPQSAATSRRMRSRMSRMPTKGIGTALQHAGHLSGQTMSPAQGEQLKRQMQDLLPLLVQSYAIHTELSAKVGSTEPTTIEQSKNCGREAYSMLCEFYRMHEVTAVFQSAASICIGRMEKKPSQAPSTYFSVPGVAHIQDVLQAASLPDANFKHIVDAYGKEIDSRLDLCEGNQISVHAQKSQVKFTASEERLLALGLERYGTDWSAIRHSLLPTKTVLELKNRYKYRCSRNCEDNPIKRFRQETEGTMLPSHEAIWLEEGVQQYGTNFVKISARFMPHRSADMLRTAYSRLNRSRKRDTNGNFANGRKLSTFDQGEPDDEMFSDAEESDNSYEHNSNEYQVAQNTSSRGDMADNSSTGKDQQISDANSTIARSQLHHEQTDQSHIITSASADDARLNVTDNAVGFESKEMEDSSDDSEDLDFVPSSNDDSDEASKASSPTVRPLTGLDRGLHSAKRQRLGLGNDDLPHATNTSFTNLQTSSSHASFPWTPELDKQLLQFKLQRQHVADNEVYSEFIRSQGELATSGLTAEACQQRFAWMWRKFQEHQKR